jgi:hypothetical protein
MSESVETPVTETAPKKERKPRGQFTVGDILRMDANGLLDAAKEKHGDNPAFQAALKAASGKSSKAAEMAGLGEGEKVCDFRKGIFLSLAALGAVEGSKAVSERVGDTIVTRLV